MPHHATHSCTIKGGCTLVIKCAVSFFYLYPYITISFHKTGGTSALRKNMQARFFAVRSVCTIFATDLHTLSTQHFIYHGRL